MFKDANGKISSGRVIKAAAFLIAATLAFIGAFRDVNTIAYVTAFLGLAGASEVISKVMGK